MKLITFGILVTFIVLANQSLIKGRNLQVEDCVQYDNDGQCTKCIFRYVLINENCVAVSDQCNTWDDITGACTSCFDGWTLADGTCTVNEEGGDNGGGDNGGNEQPAQCSERQVKIDGKCVDVSDQCKEWDATAACTSCYDGWTLADGACTAGGDNGGGDNGGGDNGGGETGDCPFRTVKIDDKCVAVSDQCKTWDDTTAACTSCYDGWTLADGACTVGGGGNNGGGDNGGQTSGDCPFRTVKIDDKCVAVSDQCKTWDDTTAACTSCYDGWTLADGACTVGGGGNNGGGDNGGETGECPFRTVKIDDNCVAVSDQCKTWDDTTAACTSCYDGWTLADGACTVGGGGDNGGGDNGGETPSECPFRTVKIDGKCVAVSDQCKTWDEATAACTSCYEGWTLADGACTV